MNPVEEGEAKLGEERLAPASVLAIGEQIAAALASLHRRGAVHRAVRPAAIGFDAAASRAWLLEGGAAATPFERVAWASPEQIGRAHV